MSTFNILVVLSFPERRSLKIQAGVKKRFAEFQHIPGGMESALKDIMSDFGIRSMNEKEKFLVGIYLGKLLHANETISAARELQTPAGIQKMFANLGLEPVDLLDPSSLKNKIKMMGLD